MAAGPGLSHPARSLYILAAIFLLLAWILALISIFVPWSWKDTAVFQRTYINLWQNCVERTNSPLNEYTCMENDIDQVGSVAGGDKKCRGFFVATQVFTVGAVVWTFLALLFTIWIISKLWAKPIYWAFYIAMLTMFAFAFCLVAFLMWIVYAEQNCQPGNPLFPVKGYSWGWITMVVATFFAFLAMLLAYLALLKILRFKPFIPHEEPCAAPMAPVMDAPVYMEPQPYYETAAPLSYPVAYPPAVAYPPVLPTY